MVVNIDTGILRLNCLDPELLGKRPVFVDEELKLLIELRFNEIPTGFPEAYSAAFYFFSWLSTPPKVLLDRIDC